MVMRVGVGMIVVVVMMVVMVLGTMPMRRNGGANSNGWPRKSPSVAIKPRPLRQSSRTPMSR